MVWYNTTHRITTPEVQKLKDKILYAKLYEYFYNKKGQCISLFDNIFI